MISTRMYFKHKATPIKPTVEQVVENIRGAMKYAESPDGYQLNFLTADEIVEEFERDEETAVERGFLFGGRM